MDSCRGTFDWGGFVADCGCADEICSVVCVMFVYSVFYAATLPLVNAVLFANVTDAAWQGRVFMWAPIAWAIAGYFLTGLAVDVQDR